MCTYWKNFAQQTGGAIKLIGSATAVIESCLFLSNHAENGGAVDISMIWITFILEGHSCSEMWQQIGVVL